jgi:glycogen synthase
MRILLISNLCPPYYLGGYEMACLTVACALQNRGHCVRLLTTPSHIPGPIDPRFVHRNLSQCIYDFHGGGPPDVLRYMLHESACSNFGNSHAVVQMLRNFTPDVVYCWNPIGIGGIAIFDLLNVVGIPWVLHLMGNIPGALLNGCLPHIRHVYNAGGDALFLNGEVISPSVHLLDEIEADSGVSFHDRAHIIPCWVDVTEPFTWRTYRQNGITRFVFASTIYPHKGIDLLIRAVAALKNSSVANFAVDVFGEGQVSDYTLMANRMNVQDIVQFRGSRDQKRLLQLYREYDAFVFPTSEREPFGFAPIEAAAAGCVPIITRNCGAAERLVDNVHCIKIEREVEDLVRVMSSIVSGEIDLARIGKAGAALVRTDLSLVGCMERIEAVLVKAARVWDVGQLSDPKLVLLVYIKNQLARNLLFETGG